MNIRDIQYTCYRKKSGVIDKLKEFIAKVNIKFGRKTKEIRSDNGGEYSSNEIEQYLKEHGKLHQLTIPCCLSQNGVAEK